MAVRHPFPHLLGDLLSETARRLPDKQALVFSGQRIVWKEFEHRVNLLAKIFLQMGIQRGDRIGIIATTRPEYLYVYLAAARIGAITVGFNILLTPAELTQLANLVQPSLMVVLDQVGENKIAESLKPLITSFSFVRHFIVIGEQPVPGAFRLNDLLVQGSSKFESALATRKTQVNENDPALIVFTSGSTGTPKGAVLTHKNIIDNIAVELRKFGFQENDRILLHLPMSHVAGATEISIPGLMTGATLVMMDHFHPAETLAIIAQEKVTVLGQVPTMFIMELNLANFSDYDLSSLRAVIVAGAATPPPVMHKMRQMAPTVLTGYGMTEVSGFVTYTAPHDDADTLAHTVGRIAPEFELKIVDARCKELPVGEIGEVAIRGSCVMKEYYQNPKETAAAIDQEGWFYTGDMGRLDERGYLTLVDRKKDMYITGGYNVYPREIEELISRHAKVALVACLGKPDEVLGEVGQALVVPKPGMALQSQEILEHCKASLAKYKIPKFIEIRESLPLTSLGKVDKMKLRQELQGK